VLSDQGLSIQVGNAEAAAHQAYAQQHASATRQMKKRNLTA